jgi:hypothetical protein
MVELEDGITMRLRYGTRLSGMELLRLNEMESIKHFGNCFASSCLLKSRDPSFLVCLV